MDRTLPRRPTWLLTLLLTLVVGVTSPGCVGMLTTAAFLIRGYDKPAEFKDLKGKRIAVLCRPPIDEGLDGKLAAGEVARQVGRLLSTNLGRKTDVIDQEEVADYTDVNGWEDFKAIGEALDAEMVLGIELERFSLYESGTVYRGKANVRIDVWDMENDGQLVFSRTPPQSLYPPNAGIPASVPKTEFRRIYINVLSEEIGRYFYSHDATLSFAKDSQALNH